MILQPFKRHSQNMVKRNQTIRQQTADKLLEFV